ncbi:FadR/GntR family transcriptional regulator [Streptomyces sp. NPDC060223]|uniref:FadR/GntR family transcriptional regulator n=1 Tax=unclassified Streptomyces TaxID=2593676 RepID=UPI00363962E1
MARDSTGGGADRRIGRGRIADQIVGDLREGILSGELANGSRLPAERELAEQYGVSGSTIREAVRVLATVGLVSVRHGSGTFVTAEYDTMLGMTLASVARLEGVGAGEVLGMLGALSRYAAKTAVDVATDDEIASLRAAAEKLAVVADTDGTLEDLRTFMRRLSEISHNALVIPVCRLLADVQVELVLAMSGGEVSELRRVVGGLHADRMALVEAVESRSAQRAANAVEAHAAHAVSLIQSSPRARKIQVSDPGYSQLLAGILKSRLDSTMQ